MTGQISADRGLRFFLAHTDGHIDVVNISASVSAAMDILLNDRVPEDRAAEIALAAERSGKDPEAFARHFVKLHQAMREPPDRWPARTGDEYGADMEGVEPFEDQAGAP